MENHNGAMCVKAGFRYLLFGCCFLWLGFSCVMSDPLKSEACFIVYLNKLKNADCHNQKLTTVPQWFDHDIKVFKLQENQITVLTDGEFEKYPSLQEIYLTGNRIDVLLNYPFKGLQNLQILDLENNELKAIPSATFVSILSLRILNLKSNQIYSIEEESFKVLTKLERINLENCYITFVHPKAFLGLENLHEINIANNELAVLDSSMESAFPGSLEIFRIHDNKWICDCKLQWLRIWTSNSSVNWEFNKHTPSCSGPQIINGVSWKSLSAEQFACAPKVIETNKSTSIEVKLHENLTMECLITGDPTPNVVWIHNSKEYSNRGNVRTDKYTHHQQKFTKTVLQLHNVRESDVGVYKCFGKNLRGSAEISYSIKLIGIPPPEKKKELVLFLGLKKNVAIGICVVFAALLLIFLIIICGFLCYVTTKKNNQNRAYKVREYQRPSNNVVKQEKLQNNDKCSTKPKTKSNRYVESNSDKQFIAEQQELLHEKPPIHETTDISGVAPEETSKQVADNRFKMKIFTDYGQEGNSVSEHQGPNHPTPPPEAEANSQPAPMAEGSHIKTRPDRETPDLLKDRIITNRAIPVPPPSVPNHIQSTHPRARENPYVTASELKASTLKKRTASADDLLDGREGEPFIPGDKAKRSSSRDDILQSPNPSINTQPKKTRFQEPLLKQRDHSSTCTNPVCMKDMVMSPPQKPRPEHAFKQGKGGGYYGKGAHREIDVDDLSSPDSRYDGLGYKTIPARLSKSHCSPEPKHFSPPTSSHGSPSKSSHQDSCKTLPKRSHIPSKTVSFSEEGHPIIDLTQEMPEPIVISGFGGPSESSKVKPNPAGTYSTLPHPKTQPILKMGHVNGNSPTGRPSPTTQCTTLDDLLSPPFGQSPSGSRKLTSQTLPRKKSPKPGEKDEFGTAV